MEIGALNVRIVFVAVAALAALMPGAAVAQPAPEPLPWQLSKKWPINEDDPEASVPNMKGRNSNPLEFGYLLQDLIEGAEMARQAGDWYGVVRYYRAIVKGAPERAKGWSKLCEAYALVNDHERAAATCGAALSRPGVELQDYTRFVHETLLIAGKPTAANAAKLKDVLAHLDKQPNIELVTAGLRCEIGAALGDSRLLEAGTAAMTRLAPNDPKTVIYQWTLAMQRGVSLNELEKGSRPGGFDTASKGFSKKDNKGNRIFWIVVVLVVLAIAGGLAFVFLTAR